MSNTFCTIISTIESFALSEKENGASSFGISSFSSLSISKYFNNGK